MNEGTPIDSGLLASYLAGEADASQRTEVERWAAADPANGRELQRLRRIWETAAEGLPLAGVDEDRAWARLQARMDEGHAGARVLRMTPLRWLAAAAVVAGVVFGTRILFGPATTRLVAGADPVHAMLEDSTQVVLAPGTRVQARMGDERRVELHGKAYFEVTKDAARPFVVSTDELTVTVLGTSFEVVAYDSASTTSVRVREGRVQVVAGRDTAVLGAGEVVRFDRAKHALARGSAGPVEQWGDRILQFDQAPMSLVLQQLQERYGVEVTLENEAIGRCALTATFEHEPIDVVLQVIAETFGLELRTVAPARFILAGDGC